MSHYFHLNLLVNNIRVSGEGTISRNLQHSILEASDWMSSHYSVVTLLKIPLFALGTYIGLQRIKLNYLEHLVVHLYLASQRLVIQLVMFPILVLLKDEAYSFQVVRWMDIAGYLLMAFSLAQFIVTGSVLLKVKEITISFAISFLLLFCLLYAIVNMYIL